MKKYEKFDLLWSTFRKEWLDEAMENYEKEESAFSYLSCPEDYTKFNPVQRLIDTCEDNFEVDVIDCRKIKTQNQALGTVLSLNEGSVVIIEYPDAIYDSESPIDVKNILSNIWKIVISGNAFVGCRKHLTICPFIEGKGKPLPWSDENILGRIDKTGDIYLSPVTKENDLNNDITEERDYVDEELIRRLNSVGKYTFVNIMYPILSNTTNIDNIDVAAILRADSTGKFGRYTRNAQNSRLTNSKWIFRNNLVCEALKLVMVSTRTDNELRNRAEELYRNFGCPFNG